MQRLYGTDPAGGLANQIHSLRINRGRFFFSDSPYAILERGKKISLVLFKEIKKKALLKLIRSDMQYSDTPVILWTTEINKSDIIKA